LIIQYLDKQHLPNGFKDPGFIMSQPIFCPLCQRKNSADAKHCVYCGIKFVHNDLEIQTTNQISKQQSAILGEGTRGEEYLSQLTPGALALFIMDVEQPVVIEEPTQIIIGRHLEAGEVQVVDLANFGGAELGISRRHLQISHSDGQFMVMDLGSTNGSWLNRQRLTPGMPYRLHHNDQILLGQMRLFAVFHTDEANETFDFQLKDGSLPESHQRFLNPHYLAGHILPVIEAIDTIHRISALCQGRTPNQIYVEAISANEQRPLVTIRLVGATTTIRLIEKWVAPWRANYLTAGEAATALTTGELAPKINQLALKLLADLVAQSSPAAKNVDIKTHLAELLPSLKLLATGPLFLYQESSEAAEKVG
jgi:hypothetical protein